MKPLLFLVFVTSFLVLLSPVHSIPPRASSHQRASLKPSFTRPSSSSDNKLLPIPPHVTPAFNTSSWFGAAYTPSPAGNQLWWYEYSRYEPIIRRELTAVSSVYGFTALRTFIHNMVYDAAPEQFLANIERYLTLCASLGLKPGFVFFDDCWNADGATIPDSLRAGQRPPQRLLDDLSPQHGAAHKHLDRFKSYVVDVVTRFKDDERVLYWEVFNEPNSTPFTQALRNAAYGWAMDVKPVQPVISCWGDNNNTQIVDEHRSVPTSPTPSILPHSLPACYPSTPLPTPSLTFCLPHSPSLPAKIRPGLQGMDERRVRQPCEGRCRHRGRQPLVPGLRH